MAICVHCTTFVPSLWTEYSSATNVRLSLCPTCHQFADLYVEQPLLVLVLDLILMNAQVYRHLLFNRGTPPTKVGQAGLGDSVVKASNECNAINVISSGRKKAINQMLLFLTIITVFSESYLRYAAIWSQNDNNRSAAQTTIFARCMVESFLDSLAFQGSITLGIVLALTSWRLLAHDPDPRRGSRLGSISMLTKLVPLSIQLSSCPKLVLLLLVSIWRPESSVPNALDSPPTSPPLFSILDLSQPLGSFASQTLASFFDQFVSLLPVLSERLMGSLTKALEMSDRDQVIRTVLGGLGAGFGLSVLLKPVPLESSNNGRVNIVDDVLADELSRKEVTIEDERSRLNPKRAMKAWIDSVLIILLILWGYISKEYVCRYVLG